MDEVSARENAVRDSTYVCFARLTMLGDDHDQMKSISWAPTATALVSSFRSEVA